MPERTHHTDALRVGTPFSIGSVTLLPIERVVLHAHRGNGRTSVMAVKEAIALIVREAGATWAMRCDASSVSLEELCEQVAGLESVLAAM